MTDPLITPAEAQRMLAVPRSTFWEIVAEEKVERVEFSPRVIRFHKSKIEALIEKHTVRAPSDRDRLADGRRS